MWARRTKSPPWYGGIYQAGIDNLTQRFGSVSNPFGRHWNSGGFQIPGRRGFHDSSWPISAYSTGVFPLL